MKQEFKAGDKVYCPEISNTVHILTDICCKSKTYEVRTSEGNYIHVDEYGRYGIESFNPTIFHATPENHELLCRLYGMEFEPPPKRKEPREIIKAMLKAGYDGVPCKTDSKKYRFVCVNVSDDPYFPFVYDSLDKNDAFSSAIPYCYQTGKTIIDFVDGEIVTE